MAGTGGLIRAERPFYLNRTLNTASIVAGSSLLLSIFGFGFLKPFWKETDDEDEEYPARILDNF